MAMGPSRMEVGGIIPGLLSGANPSFLFNQRHSEALLADQARTAFLHQQLIASRNHYPVTLQDQLMAAHNAQDSLFKQKFSLPPGTLMSASNGGMNRPAVSQNRPSALEALGSSLRSKSDPYIDVSALEDPDPQDSALRRTRGGVSEPFPEKLQRMLREAEDSGMTDVVSFFSHGRAFGVHDIDRFTAEIMPKYFKQSKWNSFARQLNLYGFQRISTGPDSGGYYHELFLKGRPNLCLHMRRVGVPQGEDRRKFKAKNAVPDPDFYSMKPVTSLAPSQPTDTFTASVPTTATARSDGEQGVATKV